MAIPMRGGFSGFVPLNNMPVAERNMMTGDMRAVAGRPVAKPQPEMDGGLSDMGGKPSPTAAGGSKDVTRRRRSKYAAALGGELMKEGSSTAPTVGSGWSPIIQGLSRAAMGGMGGYIAGRDERARQANEAAATEAYNKFIRSGEGSIGELMGDPDLNAGQQAYLASLTKDQKPFAVGKNVYDPSTGKFITPQGPGGAALPDVDDWAKINRQYEGAPGVSRLREVQPILASMQQSINDNTAMADLDFVYGMAKILDPNSAVKEGEMGLVMSSQALPEAFVAQINKMIEGKGGLSVETRTKLYQVARRRAEQFAAQAQQEQEYFSKLGSGYGVTPEMLRAPDVLPEYTPQQFAPEVTTNEAEPTPEEVDAELRRRGVIK